MTPIAAIKKEVLRGLSAPVLVKVDKAFIKKETGGYCFDGVVLVPETLEETGEILKEISITSIWAGAKGQGVFCPPESGQIAIVNFVGFNRAFPFYVGIYSDDYTPSDGEEGSFIIADGLGGKVGVSKDGLFTFLNKAKSLKVILEELTDGFISLKTIGSPTAQALSPDQVALMTKLKGEIALLFKE